MLVFVGVVVVTAGVFLGFVLEGGPILLLIQPVELMIIGGASVGALLIGVGETLTTAYVAPEWQTAVPYVVIFVVLLVRPQGLLGMRTREDVAVV